MSAPIILIVRALGRLCIDAISALGRLVLFALATLSQVFRPPFYLREFFTALLNVGYLSLPVVGLTALFTGAALALQIYSGGSRFNAPEVVPQIVAIGMVRELGPVLVGLMIAARVTSSIAAEMATMKVTEQIDALVTLSTAPMKYLVMPRVLAGLMAGPVLVAVADSIGIFGGFIVATQTKGMAFGFIATLMGCYYGLNSGRGAQGVGKATKASVQAAAVLILAANFALTAVFFSA